MCWPLLGVLKHCLGDIASSLFQKFVAGLGLFDFVPVNSFFGFDIDRFLGPTNRAKKKMSGPTSGTWNVF